MRISIATTENALTFMRRAGYGYQKEGGGEVAFVRRVGSGLFPRFHGYTIQESGRISVNLHVDQKAPTYGRGAAHSGEYDGPLIEQEALRLQQLAQVSSSAPGDDLHEQPRKKGFFGRLFS